MLGGCTFPPYCCHHDRHCGCMYLPSPSLSKRAKASLNSAVCSSVSWSAILILMTNIWKISGFVKHTMHKWTIFWSKWLAIFSWQDFVKFTTYFFKKWILPCNYLPNFNGLKSTLPHCTQQVLVIFMGRSKASKTCRPLWQEWYILAALWKSVPLPLLIKPI